VLPVAILAAAESVRLAVALHREWGAHALGTNVWRALATLPPTYRIGAREPSLGERDRHVVVGPNGVFLVLTSDDGGRVTASDRRLFVNARLPWRNLVEDGRVEALRVADRVKRVLGRPVPVQAIVCFTRALVAVGQEIRGVKIVQVPRLPRVIESAAAMPPLADDDVETIRAALAPRAAVTSPLRPVFRLTPRRVSPSHERPLSLVGRPSAPHRHRS
jgi:hypothetical protein